MEPSKEIDDIEKIAIETIEKASIKSFNNNEPKHKFSEIISPPDSETKKRLKCCRLDLSITIVLLLCAQTLSGVVLSNQILYHTCTNIHNFDSKDCVLLGTKEVEGNEHLKKIEETVQSYAANIFMIRSLIDAVIPAIVCLFLGPWSDKFGRKPVILLVSSGFCLTYSLVSLLTLIASYSDISPWLYIVMLLPAALSGGNCSILSTFFAYIADLTSVEERPIRIGIAGAYIAFGFAFGSLTGGYLYSATNAFTVFIVSASLIGLSIAYTAFFVKESLKRVDTVEEDVENKIRNLFKFTLIKEVFYCCCKKISGSKKIIVWCTLLSMGLGAFVAEGGSTVGYLFVRQRFTMSVTEFTVYQAVGMVVVVVGAVFGLLVLHSYFKISEATLTLVSITTAILDALIHASASEKWQLYIAVAITSLKGLRMPMCQALLSRVIPSNDIGKVFSLSTGIEAITPFASVPLYTFIYSNTLATYPGTFYLFSAGILGLSFIAMIFVLITEVRSKRRGENLNC